MKRFSGIAAATLLLVLPVRGLAFEVPAEARVDRTLVKSFAKDATATTVTFNLYMEATCSEGLFATASMPLSDLGAVARIKNEALKNDSTPSPKEEWLLSASVPVTGLPESAFTHTPFGNVYARVTLSNGGDPVVSSCQRQKNLTVASSCGDGFVAYDEDCEGSDLSGQDCHDVLSTVGSLSCTSECEFDTSACGVCPGTGGVIVAETCWYLANTNQSCTDACAAVGLPYSSMTLSYAGSAGTTAQCFAVLDAMGITSPPASDVGDFGGSTAAGCLYDPLSSGYRVRIIEPAPTTADAVDYRRRVCACEY